MSGWTVLRPGVLDEPELAGLLRACAAALAQTNDAAGTAAVRAQFLEQVTHTEEGRALELRVLVGVLCDLRAMGWSVRLAEGEIQACPPGTTGMSATDQKRFVREGHLIERDAQLAQKSTRAFTESMERRRATPRGWHSIFSLMRDGRDLAAALTTACGVASGPERDAALTRLIRPYVQVARRGERCQFTGLDLMDVWRYFRHTWTTVYQSTPGRSLAFLVRDAAAPNHPVIGIAALGSSIVQLRVRDAWIGWTGDAFLTRVRAEPSVRWARWLHREFAALLDEVYWADFAEEGLIAAQDLIEPSEQVISTLRDTAAEARRMHRLYPQHTAHKQSGAVDTTDWVARSRTHLFRFKRAQTLADLLAIRRDLDAAGFGKPTTRHLQRALSHPRGEHAVLAVLRRAKARRVGVGMMDITVCGAIAPYNALLGGKLVSLLMASSEVTRAYSEQYRRAVSVIASGMAGRAIVRSPNLVFLGTTSLYGTSASQYNRVRMPIRSTRSGTGGEICFEQLGRTSGFGSYHFSADTLEGMEVLLAQHQRGREVNSIFGEGVNPKLRKVRAALEQVGLPGDLLLRHGQSRLVYGLVLASNFRDVLIGLADRPRYVLPQSRSTAPAITRFWVQRWLGSRIERPEILDVIASHGLAYPVRHGARVPREECEATELMLALQ